MSSIKKQIEDLKIENDLLRKENAYLKSPLYMEEICEIIKNEYSNLLNPPEFVFHTTKNQKACSFKVNINDIVCVLSEGKTKWVYFNEPQSSIDGIRHVSDKLSFTGSLENFCEEYDKPKIHLCQISKSVVVNLFYYYLDRDKVKLFDSESEVRGECKCLTISKNCVNDFTLRKNSLKRIISFQKIDFQGNYIYHDDAHDSFETNQK